MVRSMRRLVGASGIAALALALAGCGLTVPSDPDGTLETVSGGVLEVGVTPNPPFTEIDDADDEEPSGTEVTLVESFAASIDAELSWTVGSEEDLVRQLEEGDLDLVIGGITERTPWAAHAAPTRAYAQALQPDGSTTGVVMLTPMGENAFLAALEQHLDEAAP